MQFPLTNDENMGQNIQVVRFEFDVLGLHKEQL